MGGISEFFKKLFGGGKTDDMAAQSSSTAASGGGSGNVMGMAGDMMSGQLPDVAKVQEALGSLSETQVQGAVTHGLQGLDSKTLGQLGGMVQGFLSKSGSTTTPPAGLATGNPTDIGQILGGVLKGQGLGALSGILGKSTGGAAAAPGASAGGGGFDLSSLISNPMARQVIMAILPAILKAAGK